MAKVKKMKELNTIMEVMEAKKAELQALEAKEMTLTNELYSFIDSTSFKSKIQSRKDNEKELNKIDLKLKSVIENQKYLRNYIKVLENNYNSLLCDIVIPQVIEITKKYNNKKIGDKTKEKLINELNNIEVIKDQYRFYFGDNYGYKVLQMNKKMHYNNNIINISFYSNNPVFNEENKMISSAFEEINNKYNYISDIDAYINEKEEQKKKVEELKEALRIAESQHDKNNIL